MTAHAPYRARLVMELAELCHHRPLDAEPVTEQDLALQSARQHETASVRAIQADKARMVRAAIDRIDYDDGYGLCVECRQAVDEKRLKATPWVERCKRCQERREFAVERGLEEC